jgi:putative transposase
VAGQWQYRYRAVDREGDTVDVLRRAKRNLAAARRFLERAINVRDLPEKITIDKSGANMAAIEGVKADACVDIELRQSKYLKNIVEQDHRAIKRITRPRFGFKSFWSARIIIAGIETTHRFAKARGTAQLAKPCPHQVNFTPWRSDQPTSSAAFPGHSPLLRRTLE